VAAAFNIDDNFKLDLMGLLDDASFNRSEDLAKRLKKDVEKGGVPMRRRCIHSEIWGRINWIQCRFGQLQRKAK
jgi:hypothetical protein